jgi:Protein kinase domain
MQVSGDDTTGAYRLKVLDLYLQRTAPPEVAQSFRELVGGERPFLDETAPLPRTMWVRALVAFDRLVGAHSLRRLGPHFLDSEMLGVWAELLREAETPAEVFSSVAHGQSLPGIPSFVDFREVGGNWIGRIAAEGHDSKDVELLVAEALRSEAEILPALVGYGARAELLGCSGSYQVRVRVMEAGFSMWLAPLAAILAAAMPFVMASFEEARLFSTARIVASAILGVVFGVGALIFLRWDGRQRRVSRAQRMRIAALERESFLRRQGPRDLSSPHGEPALADQYRIGKQLGVGGSGAVWHATRLKDARPVALKLIRAGVAHDVRATDRLRREAEALGLAWHPNVVEVYDTGVLPSGIAYLAMERLYGESLADRLLRLRTLPPVEVRALGLELAEALIAIHSAGLVHRDIKPGNLFLHVDEGSPPKETLKLIDFGVARISWAETRLTRPGARIGTFGYAAPEQERGEEVDGRADLYAVGITLRECLTGVGPNRVSSPSSPKLDPEPIPPEFFGLIDALVASDPDHRPPSARELKEMLLALPERWTVERPSGTAG